MIPAAESTAVAPQPHRASTSCPRHPEESFTGFCPSCLFERLSVLDSSGSSSAVGSSSSRKPPSSIKSLFKGGGGGAGGSNNTNNNNKSKPSSSFFPELRRTKSFSATKNESSFFSGVFEPQRRSCDVRTTLYSLFHQDDGSGRANRVPSSSIPPGPIVLEAAVHGPGPAAAGIHPGPNGTEDDGILTKQQQQQQQISTTISTSLEPEQQQQQQQQQIPFAHHEIEEEPETEPNPEPEPEPDNHHFLKPMKEYIDMDSSSQTKKPPRDLKELVGSFWTKLQKWRLKQKKLKKSSRHGGAGSATTLPVEKPIGRQFRETQSEIADYGFGRRSCDTDPRFSLDAGRISFDDPRYSFDEPRPSWDGYLVARSSFPRFPTMLSVVEDAHNPPDRPDALILPVEEEVERKAAANADDRDHDDDPGVPGGSVQTRDYYSDTSRRRRSFERSSSIRKTAAAVVAEIDDQLKPSSTSVMISNAKVSPATIDNNNINVNNVNANANSVRDDCSEIGGDRRGGGSGKKSRRWGKGWSIWGLIHRRGGGGGEEERYGRGNNGVVSRSMSESWPELRGGEAAGKAFNRRVFRSNSSVSWRNSGAGAGNNLDRSFSSSSTRINNNNETTGNGNGNGNVKLERNRSGNSVENGLLRFYLTPGGRRAGSRSSGHAQSITRSVMRLY